jgi:integrase
MVRIKNRLTDRKIKALAKPGKPGKWSDGDGLYLRIDGAGSRCRWFFKFVSASDGKLREMGLGGFPDVPLSDARKARDEAKRLVQVGKDPIIERDAAKRARGGKVTFGAVAEQVIELKCTESRSAKHQYQWRTLARYAGPLWPLPVDEIDTDAVLAVLTPLWNSKHVTASRVRSRIEAVLDAARAKGHIPRNEANPARWKGHLDQLLPKRQKLSRGHHAAMPYAEVPAFIAGLRERETVAALALEFCILTAVRSGEVLGAQWDEIDLELTVWTIPAARTKAGREHRVPLSVRALAIMQELYKAKLGPFVFPGRSADRPLSAMAMDMQLRRMQIEEATVHGFRSSFRDWAGNETTVARDVAEAALAHRVGDATEQAYWRGDALDKRRKLMQEWADFCSGVSAEKVVSLRREA